MLCVKKQLNLLDANDVNIDLGISVYYSGYAIYVACKNVWLG